MDISSLLCTDDPPNQHLRPTSPKSPSQSPPSISPTQSPPPQHPQPEPVILAPHLRGSHSKLYTHSKQRVHPLELPANRELRGPDLGQHVRKRSFSPDLVRDSSPLRRPVYVSADRDSKEEIVLPDPSRSSAHSANFALQQLQQQRQLQQQQQQQQHMDPSLYASSAQRSTYAQQQQRPSSSDMSMGYHSRPSSSHSHSPTLSHYSSVQSPTPGSAPPTSLSRSTTTYPFAREGPSPAPLTTLQQRGPGSPLTSFYPSSRPQQQQPLRRLSPHSHSHSPILHSATPYTYPPVPSQQQQQPPSAVRLRSSSNSMPTTPYATQHHNLPHLHHQQHHPSTSNPTSAVSKQISPYMGLEALVHAASQEQRRLSASGGRPEGTGRSGHHHRNSLDERRVSSSSPVMDRNSGTAYPITPVSPHRSHHHHHPDERPSGSGYSNPHEDARYAEYEHHRVGTLVPVPVSRDVAAEPRPIKRQRMSDPLSGPGPGFISEMAGAEERERNFEAHYGRRFVQGQGGHQQQQPPMRLSGPGAHEYAVTDRAILGIGDGDSGEVGVGSVVGVSVGDVGDVDNGVERMVMMSKDQPVAAAAPIPSLPQTQSRRASSESEGGSRRGRDVDITARVRVRELDVSEERRQMSKSTSTSSRGQTPLVPPQPPPPPLDIKMNQRATKVAQSHKGHVQSKEREKEKGHMQPATKEKEQDAHEWLLEHYAGSTPSPSSTILSTTKARAGGQSGAMLLGPRSSMERAMSRTPAPEIAATALERELELELDIDSGSGSGSNTSANHHHHHRHHEPDNTDPDVVLEMVVESLDADDNLSGNNDDRDASRSSRVSMEVDEELLSLVDDPAPVSLPPPPPPQPQPAPKQFAAPPPSLRLTKPLTPTVVTVLTPAFPSPGLAPPSPFPHNLASSERGSMPPPATTNLSGKGGAEKKGADRPEGTSATTSMKGKKAKAAPKPKQPAKPRAKASSKSKTKPITADGTSPAAANKPTMPAPPAIKKSSAAVGIGGAASRSRSTSAMPPGGSAVPEGDSKGVVVELEKDPEAEEDEAEDKEDDKLYCVCKTKYDEDRVMIACDRCDEWYHTQCVNMPDLEVDLVDQFICPPCIDSNPQLHLQTTYKKRCLRGLDHPNPASPDACHKPARGEFSKYCSDECGVKYMETKINAWVKEGGNREKLWESVRHAERRQGVVVCVDPPKDEVGGGNEDVKLISQKAKVRVERDLEKLNGQLDQVIRQREKLKKEMDVVLWRVRLVELASERSEKVDECAWDQRLCFGDEECAEFGGGVLASYEDNADQEEVKNESEDAMQVDSVGEDGAWWCRGKKKCERHAGWQKLRAAEVSFEKEVKEGALSKLTTQEREIRKRIEDLLDPQARDLHSSSTLKSSGRKAPVNGHTKRANGDTVKKGKKKRA